MDISSYTKWITSDSQHVTIILDIVAKFKVHGSELNTLQADVLFWFSAVATILYVKSRGRLGRVESVTDGVGIRAKENPPTWQLRPND